MDICVIICMAVGFAVTVICFTVIICAVIKNCRRINANLQEERITAIMTDAYGKMLGEDRSRCHSRCCCCGLIYRECSLPKTAQSVPAAEDNADNGDSKEEKDS